MRVSQVSRWALMVNFRLTANITCHMLNFQSGSQQQMHMVSGGAVITRAYLSRWAGHHTMDVFVM